MPSIESGPSEILFQARFECINIGLFTQVLHMLVLPVERSDAARLDEFHL